MLTGLTGIICAMESELRLYRQALQFQREEKGLLFGSIGPSRVVLGLCGPGKVNAAICAQSLLLLAQPDRVINTGVAGALAPDLHTLDTVIASAVCQHDIDSTALGDEPGLISGIEQVFVPCDPTLQKQLLQAAQELGFPARAGVIASGDQFLADEARKRAIRQLFGADCGEMETGPIGQACFLAGVPFAALRVLSDSGDGSAPMVYRALVERASDLSSRILLQLLS